jgi:hypothetical protein
MATARYYLFTPCCEGDHPLYFQVSIVPLSPLPYVYSYTGPNAIDSLGHILETNKCYSVTEVTTTDLVFVAGLFPCPSELLFVAQSLLCPINPTVECPCEIPQNICVCSRATNLDPASYTGFRYFDCNGVLSYYPNLLPGETGPNICLSEWIGVYTPGTFEYFGDCIDGNCPENITYSVYNLEPCCGGQPTMVYLINSSLNNLTTYIYNSNILNGNLINSTCYTAREINYIGVGVPPFTQVVISEFLEVVEGCGDGTEPYSSVCELFCLPCICTRFLWTGAVSPGTYSINYIDCNNDFQILDIPTDGVTWTDKICLKYVISICPSPILCWTTETFGDCNIINSVYECNNCYELRDCTGIKDSVYTFNQQVGQYVSTQQVIQIVGDETCWRVFDTDDACECAVAVTVQTVFSNCPSCLTPKGFKLTECTTGEIQYTTTDLSDYTTAILQTDCPGCWTVEPIDIVPPSSQPVTVVASFKDCEICNSVFYELVACNEILDSIVTITDLSQYVGQFIKLEYCPNTCWKVTITTPQEINGDVIVDQNFTTCSDCTDTLTDCKCQSAVNNLQIAKTLRYLDCNSTEKSTAILLPGQRSEKVCALFWFTGENIIDYGSCINDAIAKQFTCPVTVQPKRKVTPGYNTAVCSTEYYERVVCNFADWMYKDVLERRYGISNCCPEELIKWEIKHEMLMLDVLVNPDYVCSTGSACNCPSSCDCGYISLTTKNGTCPS